MFSSTVLLLQHFSYYNVKFLVCRQNSCSLARICPLLSKYLHLHGLAYIQVWESGRSILRRQGFHDLCHNSLGIEHELYVPIHMLKLIFSFCSYSCMYWYCCLNLKSQLHCSLVVNHGIPSVLITFFWYSEVVYHVFNIHD